MKGPEVSSLEDPLSDLKRLQRLLFDISNVPLATSQVVGRLIEGTGSSLFFNVNTLLSCVEGMPFKYIAEFSSRNALIPDIASAWQLSRCIYDTVGRFSHIFKAPELIEVRALSFKKKDLQFRVKKWDGILIDNENYKNLLGEVDDVDAKLSDKLKIASLSATESKALLNGDWFSPHGREEKSRQTVYSKSFDEIFFVQSSSMIHGGYFLSRILSAFPNREDTWRSLRMPVMTTCSCVSKYLIALGVFPTFKDFLKQQGVENFLSEWATISEKEWKDFGSEQTAL